MLSRVPATTPSPQFGHGGAREDGLLKVCRVPARLMSGTPQDPLNSVRFEPSSSIVIAVRGDCFLVRVDMRGPMAVNRRWLRLTATERCVYDRDSLIECVGSGGVMTSRRPRPEAVGPVPVGEFETVEEILAVFRPIMRAIVAASGPACEVVLHDLSAANPDLEKTIVAIENGQVTGRRVGGPSTSLGAGVIQNRTADHDAFGYRGFTDDGRQLRCSSIYFRNSQGMIIAALCVNFDVSAIQRAWALLNGMLPGTPRSHEAGAGPDEFIGRDLVAVMDAMVTEEIRRVGKPVTDMTREDRIDVLVRLDRQGVLQMRKGVESVASRLGISRVTAYAYLSEAHGRPIEGEVVAAASETEPEATRVL